jgi:hypothetical protein
MVSNILLLYYFEHWEKAPKAPKAPQFSQSILEKLFSQELYQNCGAFGAFGAPYCKFIFILIL